MPWTVLPRGCPAPVLLRLATTIVLAVLAITAGFSPYALAVHTTGVFEMDGNSVPTATDDWDTIAAGPGHSFDHVFIDDTAKPDPTIHHGGDKDEQGLSQWECVVKNNPNDKLDIRYAYAAAYKVGGDVVVYFGQNRESNNGDAAAGFWFLQDKVTCDSAGTGKFTGLKRDGDLLVVTPFTNGGKVQSLELYRWVDPTPLAPESGDEFLDLVTSTTLSCIVSAPDHHSANPDVCAVSNAAAITTAWDGSVDTRKFVEGGINLSALFKKYLGKDVCYVSFLAETRSSQALTSDLEDFVRGDLATCGSITVEKATQPSGSSELFSFVTAGGPDAGSDAYQLKDGSSPHTTFDVRPGTYTITETVPAGWELSGATCVGGPFGASGTYNNGSPIVVEPGDSIVCTFVNTQRGRITVDKVTDPAGEPQLFGFVTAGGPDGVSDAYALADATAPHTTTNLKSGTYTVAETAPGGWSLTGAVCVGGPFGVGAAYVNGAPIVLHAGDDITCTFTNTKQAPALGSITVDKVTVPAGSPQLFTFTTAGGAISDVFALADATPPHTTVNVPAGSYAITETLPAGWTLSQATCSGGPFPAPTAYVNGSVFAFGAGEHVSCTFINTPNPAVLGSITVDKITVPGGSPQLFDFTVAGGPDALSDAFQLAHATAPHTTPNLKAGTYTVTETVPAGWSGAATCAGGPFGAGGSYTSGSAIALGAGAAVTCTFTNTLHSTGGFCPNASTVKITTPAGTGRFPGNKGMDVVVRVDKGESIQAAIDQAADLNGDGYILIGVQGKSSTQPGGYAYQRIVIDDVYAKPFGLIGCSVTLYDPAPQDGVPVIDIQASAASPDLFVMGLYVNGSAGPGWRVDGNKRYVYSSNVTNTATGIWVTGDNNTIELGTFAGNSEAGILVSGNGNTIKGVRAVSNGGHGIAVVGHSNKILSNDAGDLSRGNGGDGINVTGKGNELRRNRVFANLGDGIEVTGGTAAAPNTIVQNVVGDRGKSNQGYGIFVYADQGSGGGGPTEVDDNTVRGNLLGGIFLAPTAPDHELRNNVSGGTTTQDNVGCEFNIAAGNVNALGNQANRVKVKGSFGSPFPAGCLGTP